MTSPDEALKILERLHAELRGRQAELKKYADYYDGKQPLRYASPEFSSYWGGQFESFSDNWCQVVVDSKTERLVVRGVRIGQELADEETWRVWQSNGLDADSGLAFVDTLAQGRAFALVWNDPDDDNTPLVTFESAHEAIVAYEPGSRRKRVAALKNWLDLDGNVEHATLYLPDSVWKFSHQNNAIINYVDREPARGGYPAGPTWALTDLDTEDNPQPNPMGIVPMVELTNRSRLAREPVSEIVNVVPLQNAVNVIWSHLITASDFAAFPQRVVLGQELPKKPVINEAGEVQGWEPADISKFALDRIIFFENPEASIANWAAADLENYTKVIETAVGHIAAQTRTPQHYLVGKMANLSAEALKAAETGLVSTVREKQLYLGEAVREIARLIALVQGDEARADGMRTASVVWKDPESRSDAELADSLGKLAQMLHVPDKILWRRYGFTDDEIREMESMQDEQAQRELDMLVKTQDATAPPEPPPGTQPPPAQQKKAAP